MQLQRDRRPSFGAFEERHTNEGGPRGQNRDIPVGFLNWVGAFLPSGPSPSPLVRQVCNKHPAFSVSPVVPFQAKFRQICHLSANLLGPFQVFSDNSRQFQAILGFFGALLAHRHHTHTPSIQKEEADIPKIRRPSGTQK